MARRPTPPTAVAKRYATKDRCSALHEERFGVAISPRTLERWTLPWVIINGRAACPEDAFLAEAARRIKEAPVIQGGHRAQRAA